MMDNGNAKTDLEVLISKKEQKLSELLAERDMPKEQVTHNAGNAQVGYYTLGVREGLEKEIVTLREEISQLKNEIRIIEKRKLEKEQNKHQIAAERQKEHTESLKEQEEAKKSEEQMHKLEFERVKNIYKQHSNFLERAVLKFKGKGLKAASAYTNDELEYLIATYKGETTLQQTKQKYIEKNYSLQEQPQKIKESNINSFKKMIAIENLNDYIEQEEMNQGRSR